MNCKPGDLAIVIGASYTPEMIGHIVTVIRSIKNGEVISGLPLCDADTQTWLVRGANPIPTRTRLGKLLHLPERPVADEYLRPIRDNDGEDETLTWKDVPHKEHA